MVTGAHFTKEGARLPEPLKDARRRDINRRASAWIVTHLADWLARRPRLGVRRPRSKTPGWIAPSPPALRSAASPAPADVRAPTRRDREEAGYRARRLALLGGGWLWLRNSPLVAVERVQIAGVQGVDAGPIDAALRGAARRESTLNVNVGALRAAVAPFRVVRAPERQHELPPRPAHPRGRAAPRGGAERGGCAHRGRRRRGRARARLLCSLPASPSAARRSRSPPAHAAARAGRRAVETPRCAPS